MGHSKKQQAKVGDIVTDSYAPRSGTHRHRRQGRCKRPPKLMLRIGYDYPTDPGTREMARPAKIAFEGTVQEGMPMLSISPCAPQTDTCNIAGHPEGFSKLVCNNGKSFILSFQTLRAARSGGVGSSRSHHAPLSQQTPRWSNGT